MDNKQNPNIYRDVLLNILKNNTSFPKYENMETDYPKEKYIKLVLREVSELPQRLWLNLILESQNWYNDQVDFIEKGYLDKIDLPGLPDKKEIIKEDPIPVYVPDPIKDESIIVKKPKKPRKGVSKSDSTPEQLRNVRLYILKNNVSKQDVIHYIRNRGYRINPFVIHRLFIEGIEYKKLVKGD